MKAHTRPAQPPEFSDAAHGAAMAFLLSCQDLTPEDCTSSQFFGVLLDCFAGWNQASDAKKDGWKLAGAAYLVDRRKRGAA